MPQARHLLAFFHFDPHLKSDVVSNAERHRTWFAKGACLLLRQVEHSIAVVSVTSAQAESYWLLVMVWIMMLMQRDFSSISCPITAQFSG